MGTMGFRKVVASEQRLREILGQPGTRAILKDQARLDEHFRAFIASSPFLLLATANTAGGSGTIGSMACGTSSRTRMSE